MYGQTKIGKTKFLASEEGSFWAMTERGHNHVSVNGVECHNYDEVMATLNKLIQAKQIVPYPFSLVVLDTFDKFIEFVETAVINWGREKFKNTDIWSIGDIGQGTGWAERTSKISGLLTKFEELKGYCAVAVIMHEAVDDLEDERGKYKKVTVNIGGKSNKAITGWADHTLAIKSVYVGDKLLRKVKLRPTRTLDAGSRGVLPEEIAWTDNDKDNYANFRKFFT